MKRFYLTGQRTLANRGCEAIIRSTVALLRQRFGSVEVVVPSSDVARDSAQWPRAEEQGVRFVPEYFPSWTRYWVHTQRLPVPLLKRAGWPFPTPGWLKQQIRGVDAVLSVGGDNYSLDYRLPSLLMGLDRLAIQLDRPVVIWGASVGPFEREPAFVPAITDHLARMSLIAVRESASESYLIGRLGMRNVVRMADPAFTLEPEPVDAQAFWPADQGRGVLGLNVSPLIERYRTGGQDLRSEVVGFVRHAVIDRELAVLLVPHVLPSDAEYMRVVADAVADLGPRVRMMNSALNASQTKSVIGGCRYFIGARTHATIAALSSAVPTVSIAYSVKAKGINWDLFGHHDPVLDGPAVTRSVLAEKLDWLVSNEAQLRTQLQERIPVARRLALQATDRVGELV